MIRQTKGRTGRHQATPKLSNNYSNHSTRSIRRIKEVIIDIALGSYVAKSVADIILYHGGQRNEK